MSRSEQMKLAAFVPGALAGGSSWRQPGVDTATLSSFDTYKRLAQKLEAGKFDTLFMNDGVGINNLDPAVLERNAQAQRWDPLTLLPALAVVTERIGLTATANTSYNEPFTPARRLRGGLPQSSSDADQPPAPTSQRAGPNGSERGRR